MIKRWIILGGLGVIVAVLLSDFVGDVVLYNPLRDIGEKAERVLGEETGELRGYASAYDDVILKKNLFQSSRSDSPQVQRKQVMADEPSDLPPTRPELKLKGIITDSFGDFVAYVEKDGAKAIAVRTGDIFGDVEVLDIAERTILFVWMEEKIELSMKKVKIIRR